MKSALLLVDLQNDFCPNGALAVAEGDVTIAVANQAMYICQQRQLAIIATQDWHPANHKSFANISGGKPGEVGRLNGLPQVWWPEHCVQHTEGAALHSNLNQHLINRTIFKGQDPEVDSYSAFFDNDRRQRTELDDWLQSQEIGKLLVMGLATDYCVKFTVCDALNQGYDVDVIVDGCRGVNLHPNNSLKAFSEMSMLGANLISLSDLQSDYYWDHIH